MLLRPNRTLRTQTPIPSNMIFVVVNQHRLLIGINFVIIKICTVRNVNIRNEPEAPNIHKKSTIVKYSSSSPLVKYSQPQTQKADMHEIRSAVARLSMVIHGPLQSTFKGSMTMATIRTMLSATPTTDRETETVRIFLLSSCSRSNHACITKNIVNHQKLCHTLVFFLPRRL